MTREEWGRRLVAAALRSLASQLAFKPNRLRYRLRCQGERWSVSLECSAAALSGPPRLRRRGRPAAETAVHGRASVRVPSHWKHGDPRLTRRLGLAVAHAWAELVEASGLGLRACGRVAQAQERKPARWARKIRLTG